MSIVSGALSSELRAAKIVATGIALLILAASVAGNFYLASLNSKKNVVIESYMQVIQTKDEAILAWKKRDEDRVKEVQVDAEVRDSYLKILNDIKRESTEASKRLNDYKLKVQNDPTNCYNTRLDPELISSLRHNASVDNSGSGKNGNH